MGMSPGGKLMYGYALGSRELGWNIREADENGYWVPRWVTPPELPPETLAAWRGTVDPEEQLRDAVKEMGGSLSVEAYGHLDYGRGVALVAWSEDVEWGETKPIDFYKLESLRRNGDWQETLRRAVAHLGITPVSPEPADAPAPWRAPVLPAYLIASYYG